MTRSTTTIQAVEDGTTTDITDADGGTRRSHGITQARQDQVYYTACFAGSALYEADQLVKDIQRAASAYRFNRDAMDADKPLDMTHVVAILGEVLDCIDLASQHLSALSTDIRCRQPDDELF